jgi:hypothetical protein
MGWHLDGRATALCGTHTHVQTADERVLPKGTAYITDLGMTGPHEGVLGRKKEKVLSVLITGMPTYFDVATGDLRVQGAVITADTQTGLARAIERVSVSVAPPAPAKKEGAAAPEAAEAPESADGLDAP